MVLLKKLVFLSVFFINLFYLNNNLTAAMEIEVSAKLINTRSKAKVQVIKKLKNKEIPTRLIKKEKHKKNNKENIKPGNLQETSVPKNKRAASTDELFKGSLKRQKDLNGKSIAQKTEKAAPLEVPIYPPLLTASPTTAERQYFFQFRPQLALLEYTSATKIKTPLNSPVVREVYYNNDPGNYFSRCVQVHEKTVFQADFLFDPSAKVLTSEGAWKTNLELMKKGLSPIGHKGIVNDNNSKKLSSKRAEEIIKQQKSYRIEVHHLTQKDTGTDRDPLCEMTHVAHMGRNDRMIVKYLSRTQRIEILHSGLTKEEALNKVKLGEYIISNVLHFRKGNSLISREDFDSWRDKYWKTRATDIENNKFIDKDHLPAYVFKKNLFDNI